MEFLESLQEYMIPVIIGICFIIGQIIKSVDKKELITDYLSLILPIVGILLAFWIEEGQITPYVLFGGLASGWASTGVWEGYKATIKK